MCYQFCRSVFLHLCEHQTQSSLGRPLLLPHSRNVQQIETIADISPPPKSTAQFQCSNEPFPNLPSTRQERCSFRSTSKLVCFWHLHFLVLPHLFFFFFFKFLSYKFHDMQKTFYHLLHIS